MSGEDKKPVKLVRMPDGSMRPTTEADAIGDIWGTQKSMSKQQAQRSTAKKKKLFGRNKNQTKGSDFEPKIIEVPKANKRLDSVGAVANPNPLAPSASKGALGSSELKKPAKPPGELKLELKLPHVSFGKPFKRLKSAPRWAYGVSALVLVPAAAITFGVLRSNNRPTAEVNGQEVSSVPEYKTLTPNGDITDTTSQKINYDPQKKVASFTDKINGYEVTVSMQPIPDTFKPAIGDNVKKVAEQFAANTVLSVDNGAAYLGTSPKGPQSFVGYRGDLLVFMTSLQKIDDKAWADYFNSLK